ncbi:MAG TPA: hypothetical protein VJU86_05615 [Pyrinomonadaceae bacterium]|nr:hypothetical protein [Pyrinomonadaceae bacterium]
MTRQETKKGAPAIGYLIEQRLRERSAAQAPAAHPDEDTISAFVEARLAEPEYLPVVSHLVECGFCRSTTAKLVRLEFELEESEQVAPLEKDQSRFGTFLSGLASHLVPSTEEDTVFAYQNPEGEPETESSEVVPEDSKTPEKTSDN